MEEIIIRTGENQVKPKIVFPSKYYKVHTEMFKAVENYVKEFYPEYEVTAVKLICKKI